MIPRILVVAGSDSGGGAGIQADIKTVMALGGYATTAITAITAQNTLGVARIETLSPGMVIAQIDAVLDDIGADAVKIGMIGSAEIAEAVADAFAARRPADHIVFDPVMIATSGAVLADGRTIAAFEHLMRLATLVTPNLPELAALTGSRLASLDTEDAIVTAAMQIVRRSGAAVLVKGGHAADGDIVDRLVDPTGLTVAWRAPRIATRHTHGTGCTLASAIAAGLAMSQSPVTAIENARRYVRWGLETAPGFGNGAGPLGTGRSWPPAQPMNA